MSGVVGLALAAKFVVELALLLGAAVAVFRLAGAHQVWRWPAAIAAAAVVAAIWGLFVAPRAVVAVDVPGRVAITIALEIAVAAALWISGLRKLGVSLLVIGVVVEVALLLLGTY